MLDLFSAAAVKARIHATGASFLSGGPLVLGTSTATASNGELALSPRSRRQAPHLAAAR